MDFINDKLTSLTAPAISRVNEMSKKRAERELERKRKNSLNKCQQKVEDNNMNASSTLSKGMPFGADTFTYYDRLEPPPPPIGFRTDLICQQEADKTTKANVSNENDEKDQPGGQQQPVAEIRTTNEDELPHQSDGHLYDGDTWSRVWFQRVMLLSLIRLLLFIRKVYEDFHATKTYNNLPGHYGHFLIAAGTLFLPTIVFTVYRVCRYLQIVLPDRRRANNNLNNNLSYPPPPSTTTTTNTTTNPKRVTTTNNAIEEDGLVTARQSPVNNNLDYFQDAKSQQDLLSQQQQTASDVALTLQASSSPAPSTAIVRDSPPQSGTKSKQALDDGKKLNESNLIEEGLKERVEIDKLGNLPDKDSVRVIIGASEQLLHGVLYIFWQLKRQVDVMGYLVERACLWRKPSESEKEELGRLRTGSDGLEWFQDFYAAFLAILVQVYTLGQHWTTKSANGNESLKISKQQSADSLFAASGSPLGNIATIDSPELSISNAAKVLSDTFRQQQALLTSSMLDGKDLLIMSELIVSSAVVVSLLIAVRRKDDGPLTTVLSMLGWGSIFASRIIIIALAFVHIQTIAVLSAIAIHLIGVTFWIYRIALDSHNDKKSEQGDESRWSEVEMEEANVVQSEQAIELTRKEENHTDDTNVVKNSNTSQWSCMEHFILILQIFTLFSIPSLFYWPIMFNLKAHYRPFKYLVLILSQNFLLIITIWSLSTQTTLGHYYLLGAVCSFSIVGFIFISLYIACKPTLTEYFARAGELFNEAEKSGIYFEFCSRVFKMPDLSKQTFKRLMNQTEKQVEVEVEEEEEINLDD